MQIQVIYKLFKSSFVIEMQEGGFSSDFCSMSVLGFDSFCALFNFDFNSFLVSLLLISKCKLNRQDSLNLKPVQFHWTFVYPNENLTRVFSF